ncbi:hypothetical protein HUT18_18460 [Streptomyces sp. NA04227]|uniref:hypothetical protein n=1 Tax=Streptomyces sp. NA04227 TaxID=2742136 RepID=UPI0015908BB1|nr:hypothetical protein [Streptomyces sp. NA04227]QKW08069.1 hypothetical protein HUT18_18460 [Streptomyces sp. NA04227]
MHATRKRIIHLRLTLIASVAFVVFTIASLTAAMGQNDVVTLDGAIVLTALSALPWVTSYFQELNHKTEDDRADLLVTELREAQHRQDTSIERLNAARSFFQDARRASEVAWRLADEAAARAEEERDQLQAARQQWELDREAELLKAFAHGVQLGKSESCLCEADEQGDVLSLDRYRSTRPSPQQPTPEGPIN